MVIQLASLVAKVGFRGKGAMSGMKQFAGATKKTGKSVKKFSKASSMDMDSLKKKFQKLGKAVKGAMGSLVSATPQLQADMLMIQFQIKDMLRDIGNALAPLMDKIVEWVTKITDWLKEKFGEFKDKVIEWWNVIKDKFSVLAEPIQKLKEAWQKFWEVVKPIWDKIKEYLGGKFGDFLDNMVRTLEFIINQLADVLGFITDLLSGDFSGAFEHLKSMFLNFATYLVDMFKGVWQTILDGFKWLIEEISDAWDSFMDYIVETYGDEDDVVVGEPDPADLIDDWYNNLPIIPSGDGHDPSSILSVPESPLASTPLTVNVNVDASGSTADAYDLAAQISQQIADVLSNMQNW